MSYEKTPGKCIQAERRANAKKKKKGVRVYLACLPNSKENDVAGAQPGKWRW